MFLALLTNKYVLGAIAILAILGGVFYYGYSIEEKKFSAYRQELEAKTNLVDTLISQRDEAIATKTVEEKVVVQTKIQKVQNDVEKIVEKPIYRNVCLDDDGLRAANSALTAGATATGSTPAEVPVPNPAK